MYYFYLYEYILYFRFKVLHWKKNIVLGTHSQSSTYDVHVCANVAAFDVNCASSRRKQTSQNRPVRNTLF